MQNNEIAQTFFQNRRFVSILGNGYNGVAVRYQIEKDNSLLDVVAKFQLYTNEMKIRSIRRETAALQNVSRLAEKNTTGGICRFFASLDISEEDFLNEFGQELANIQTIGLNERENYIEMLKRWGFKLSAGFNSSDTSSPPQILGYYQFVGTKLEIHDNAPEGIKNARKNNKQIVYNLQIQEFCGKKSLKTYMSDLTEQGMPLAMRPEEIRCWAFEMLWSLTQLHSIGVVHNDIDTQNIVLKNNPENTVQRFSLLNNNDIEWSFVAPGSENGGLEQRGKEWDADKNRRIGDEQLYEYAIPMPGTKALSVEEVENQIDIPDQGDNQTERVAMLGVEPNLPFWDRPGRFFKLCWNPFRPQIIDFGQAVLLRLRQESGPEEGIELVDTEFSLLNDVASFGANTIAYPDFYFTRALERSYETDIWDIGVILMRLCVNAERLDGLLTLLKNKLPNSHINSFKGLFPPETSLFSFDPIFELLRLQYLQSGSSPFSASKPKELLNIIVALYDKVYGSAGKRNPRLMLIVEQCLLTCLMMKALGNGVLPECTIPKNSSTVDFNDETLWPAVRHTKMFNAIVTNTDAIEFLRDTETTIFSEFVKGQIIQKMGNKGLDMIKSMLSWSPRQRRRAGIQTREQLEKYLEPFESTFNLNGSLNEALKEKAQEMIGQFNWQVVPDTSIPPLCAQLYLFNPYFVGLASPGTTEIVEIGSKQTVFQTNSELMNPNVPETYQLQYQDWVQKTHQGSNEERRFGTRSAQTLGRSPVGIFEDLQDPLFLLKIERLQGLLLDQLTTPLTMRAVYPKSNAKKKDTLAEFARKQTSLVIDPRKQRNEFDDDEEEAQDTLPIYAGGKTKFEAMKSILQNVILPKQEDLPPLKKTKRQINLLQESVLFTTE